MNRNMKTLHPVCPVCQERGHLVPEDSFSTLHAESENVARLVVQWFYYCEECSGSVTRTVETYIPLAIVEVIHEELQDEDDDDSVETDEEEADKANYMFDEAQRNLAKVVAKARQTKVSIFITAREMWGVYTGNGEEMDTTEGTKDNWRKIESIHDNGNNTITFTFTNSKKETYAETKMLGFRFR